MENELLTYPECVGEKVTVTHVQKFMMNTGKHYLDFQSDYLDCSWNG